MRPRMRKFLAGLLSLGMLLQAASPLSALAADTTTAEKELEITVVRPGTATYTEQIGPSDGGSYFFWSERIRVLYENGTYTVQGQLGYSSTNDTVTIKGINGHKPSVTVNGGGSTAIYGTLTVSDVTDFTTQRNIDGSATLTCDGDVTINSTFGGAVTNKLKVEKAQNVTVTSNYATATFGASITSGSDVVCSIKASNDVTLTNGSGPLTNPSTPSVYLDIDAKGRISLTGTSNEETKPMIGYLSVSGTGATVDVQNNGTGCALYYCYVSEQYAPTSFSVTSGGPVLRSNAQIYASEDVTLTGSSTVSYNLLLNRNANFPVIVKSNSLTITDNNSTGSNAIGYAKFTPRSSSKTYHVYKGTSIADAQEDTSVQVTNSDPFMEDVTSKYLYIGEGEPALPTALTVALTSGGTTTTAKVNPKTTSIFSDDKAVGVAYDVGTDIYTFTGQLGSRWTGPDDHDDITITGSGTAKPNVVLNKGSGDLYAVRGLLTVENVTDLTCGGIYGSANLNCAGDVNLTDGVAIGGLTVENAHNVTVAASNGASTVSGDINITCSGNVEITHSGNGTLTNSFLMLNDITGSIKLNGSGEYRENDASSTAGMLYLKNCTGTLEINSTGTGRAVSELSCTDGTLLKSVTINSKSTTAAVGYDTYYSVNIVSSGDVKITNTNGPVAGGNLTVKADTVTLNGSSENRLITDTFSADITAASLTAENSGTGAVGQVKFTKTGTGDYKVVTGSSASATDKTESALDDAGYNDTCTARYLQITPGTPAPEVPEDAEMKLTIGDEVYYLTQETYSLILPGSNHVSITSSPHGYALTGQLTSTDDTGSTPKVTIEGVNSKKLNLGLHTSNTPGYLTMGDLEIKNIGNVYVYDWVGGDLTIADVGGVETHPVNGSLTVTNAGSVSTGLVGGNMTLKNVSKVTRSYFSNSNGTIDIDAAGEVNIYGSSSTGSQISAGATISATKLVMQFSGLNGSTGTVGSVHFTRKDTNSAYRILTGDSSDAITSQAAMPDTTFDQTVNDVYLCIEPGEPEDTSELAITLNGITTKFGQNAKAAAIGSVSIIYSSTDKTYHISGAFTGDVAISGVNGKNPNVKMDNSNGSIASGDLTVTDVTNFTAESSVSYISEGILRVTAEGDVSLTGDFKDTIVSAKSLTMWNNRTNPTLGNVTFTAPDGKTYVATTDENDPTQTTEVPTGGAVSGGYLHIAPSDTPDDTPDDTPTAISGGDSGAGGAIAAVALGSAAVWGGYQAATRVILRGLLPEGAAIPANRGQLALLVWNAAGRPEPAAVPAFTDVTDADMAKAAQWCTEQGYLDAKTETTFKPDGLVTKVKVIKVWNAAFPKA